MGGSVEVRPDIETFAKIKVLGVGGSGGSAINRMIESRIRGIDFVAVNTDAQALHHNKANSKIHIGQTTTRGLGAGMDPELGQRAAEENQEELHTLLSGTDMVFITCGLGGGTGTGASPVIADIARDAGALTVAVVTKPFSFEGAQRNAIAEQGFADLADRVDTIITIPNDRLLQVIDKKTSLLDSFEIVDDILRQGVQGIAELITVPGLINVDFADVKAIMKDQGSALMGIGRATGENRAVNAAKAAIDSPLLELSIQGAQGILFTIAGGPSLTMYEVNEAAKVITDEADPNAKVIFGSVIDEGLGDEIKITVIATGFGRDAKPIKKLSTQSVSFSPIREFEERPGAASMERPMAPAAKKEKVPVREERMPVSAPAMPQTRIKAKTAPEKTPEEREEEELEIPAFIRKKMM